MYIYKKDAAVCVCTALIAELLIVNIYNIINVWFAIDYQKIIVLSVKIIVSISINRSV